ncbi:MAG: hypothetical protein JNL58_22430 [Planctomyces sp.]|nr:hypothetical protein [Planctomyces sp.]
MKSFSLSNSRLAFVCLLAGSMSLQLFNHPSTLAADDPVAGAVQSNSGIIFRGMCSRETTLSPDGRDERIEVRKIDQGFRHVYIASQNSNPVVINPQDWPNQSFRIRQKAVSRKPIPDIIGVPDISDFDENGIATVRLRLAQGREEEITVAITQVNELFADVTSLTHNWQYRIPLSAIPQNRMFPGILERVDEFSTSPWRRLELVRMLMKAGLIDHAGRVLDTIAGDFPELQGEGTRVRDSLRTQLGERILEELDRRNSAGQFQLALSAARLFPKDQLAPETLVRASQIIEAAEATQRRIESLRVRLEKLPSAVQDEEQSRRSAEMIQLVLKGLNANTVDRFGPFELLADEQGDPVGAVALAVSGWLLGPESAIQNLQETWGLFEARLLVLDYMQTQPEEHSVRVELLAKIEQQEGVGPDRMAALIRSLPAIDPVHADYEQPLAEGRFRIEATESTMGCTGIVPPEYSDSRSYPLLIAFPREFTESERAVDLWIPLAIRHGYVVVTPEAWEENHGAYDAAAQTHQKFLQLVRQIKLRLRIDDTRVFVAGHGIGGEAAIDMATAHPDLFAGVASIASLGREHFKWTAHNHPEVPWYVVVGEKQGNWHGRLGVLLQRLFRRESETRLLTDLTFIMYPGRGFERFTEERPFLFEWMSKHQRDRYPALIHANLLRSSERRWFHLLLESIPERFAELDAPSEWRDARKFRPAPLECRLTENNGILCSSMPSSAVLMLSPGMPGIDLDKPITIVGGRQRKTIDYAPKIGDMLTEFYETADRDRLCFMKHQIDAK